MGSELHAAPTAPQISSSSSSPFSSDTLAHENPPKKGAAFEWRATELRHHKPWKPPDLYEVLHESGGELSALGNVPVIQDHLGPAAMAKNVDARLPEPSSIDANEQGGALPVVGAAPALAKDTASAEPASEAEKAIAARPEALMSKAQDKAACTPPKALPQKGKCKPEVFPRRGEHTNEPPLDALPRGLAQP